MPELKACIFDMDGVIVNSAELHFTAWKRIASILAIDIEANFNNQLKGLSRVDSLEKILQKGNLVLDNETKMSLMDKKNSLYLESIKDLKQSYLLPGVLTLLKELKENSIKIALGSSSKNADIILEKTEVTHYFDEVIDGNKVKLSKPDPEVFLRGAKALGLDPSECIVIEDAISGIKAAKAGGFFSIAIGDESDFPHADYIISSLHELNLDKLRAVFSQQ